jgi:hypothetical protein
VQAARELREWTKGARADEASLDAELEALDQATQEAVLLRLWRDVAQEEGIEIPTALGEHPAKFPPNEASR